MKKPEKEVFVSDVFHGDEDEDFESVEAYKKLRTNLSFCLPKNERCHIVGFTSSIRGEGKSTVARNLAYSLAYAGEKTLVIDMDMRMPTQHNAFSLNKTPGISNLLAGMTEVPEIIQPVDGFKTLFFIACGDIPPNPSELLNSERLPDVLCELANDFDYILIDLPPVDIVTDPVIVSKLTDGIIFVVRQGYNKKRLLDDALRQIELAEIKILGFVVNDSRSESGKYKYKYKYGYIYRYGNKKSRRFKFGKIKKKSEKENGNGR